MKDGKPYMTFSVSDQKQGQPQQQGLPDDGIPF